MVPFFGHETSTFQGAAVFAWISGAPILPYQCIRIEPFRFRLVIGPPMYCPFKYQVAGRMTVLPPDPCRHSMDLPVHRIQFGSAEMMLPATVPAAPSICRYTTLLMRCRRSRR